MIDPTYLVIALSITLAFTVLSAFTAMAADSAENPQRRNVWNSRRRRARWALAFSWLLVSIVAFPVGGGAYVFAFGGLAAFILFGYIELKENSTKRATV